MLYWPLRSTAQLPHLWFNEVEDIIWTPPFHENYPQLDKNAGQILLRLKHTHAISFDGNIKFLEFEICQLNFPQPVFGIGPMLGSYFG